MGESGGYDIVNKEKTGWLFITPGPILTGQVMDYPLAALPIDSTWYYDGETSSV
jgi:hypothetical protein